jgi:hypothetical protein
MKNTLNILIFSASAIFIGVMAYLIFKPKKSFLEMDEDEKRKFVEKETEERRKIINDPNLTQQQKNEKQEFINKTNLLMLSEEERKEIADFNLKRLMSGETKINQLGQSGMILPFGEQFASLGRT